MKSLKRFALSRKLALPGAVVLAGLSAAVHAEPARYEMVVVENTRHAMKIMSLDYARTLEAVERLEDIAVKSFDVYNNLCVGYTMTRSFDKATAACDAALNAHEVRASEASPYMDYKRHLTENRRQAIALTNRGVLKAVSGDLPGAREDFASAAATSTAVKAASLNLEHLSTQLDGSSTIAQVEP